MSEKLAEPADRIASPLALLVVEDDSDTRNNLIDILEMEGYRVQAFASFAAALKDALWPDLFAIVLDRRLPDGTAEEVLPRLKTLAPQAAVVIVTGFEDVSGAISALRHGASDYLLKPVDPDTLRNRLRQLADKRQAELALQAANERMLQAERLAAIGQMMTGLVHESRNALQRIEACLDLLSLNLQGQPDSLELVARVQKAQKNLHQLFEEVRNYAAPIKLQRSAHGIRDVLEETWENLIWTRKGRQASLRFLTNGVSPRCSLDVARMEQVFRNIFENSLAACSDPVQIDVAWSRGKLSGKPAWNVSIADNGPGLNAEQREKIFEPFFTTKVNGTEIIITLPD